MNLPPAQGLAWLPAVLALAGAIAPSCPCAAAEAPNDAVETVVVIAPMPGSTIDPNTIAGEFQTVSVAALSRDRPVDVLPNLVATRLSGITLNDEQGSPFQPDFVYRGFEASPISGVAEGIAVYQDGVRLNEAFGDTVNWDLVPEFAVENFTLESSNPVFGLNSLGGAVSLTMKTGMRFDGFDAELGGGSFGNLSGHAEFGQRSGAFAVYLGIGGVHDDGFRYRSPTALRQMFADATYQGGRWTSQLTGAAALSDIGAVGPTPVQLLAADRRAVFTSPQSTRNEMELLQVQAGYRATGTLTIGIDAYFRRFVQHLEDGNTTDVVACGNDSAQLCLEGADAYPGDALYDASGSPVPASVLPRGATPGEIDVTRTRTNSAGSAVQAALTAPVGGHANNFVAGASIDYGATRYAAHGELGTLPGSLEIIGSGVVIDQAHSPGAQPPLEAPVSVAAYNAYAGFYAIDVLDITPRLFWTVSGRLNLAGIGLHDRTGAAQDSQHGFSHTNPGTGLAYQFDTTLTAYAGYSQSNRAPTAGELSCANPVSPCLLGAFLVSDPPLRQVISRSIEAGLRGAFSLDALPGQFDWTASAYRTDAAHDILLLASAVNGFGYFRNAGTTRHQGLDLHAHYRDTQWTIAASYAHLDATFRNAEILSSSSPAANADGVIFVRPGDRLPLNPANRFTLSIDYAPEPRWRIGSDLRLQDSQYFAGDAANEERPLPGFGTWTLRAAHDWGPAWEIFASLDNVLDHRYASYGTFAQLNRLPPNFDLTDPRSIAPAPGRLFMAGIRAALD